MPIGGSRTSAGRDAPHAVVAIVRHQDVAGRIHRNTAETVESCRIAHAIDPSNCGTARQGGDDCTTKDRADKTKGAGIEKRKDAMLELLKELNEDRKQCLAKTK